MRDELDVEAWLRRLRLLGVVVPLLCIIALHLLMKQVLDRLWPRHTELIGWTVGGLGLLLFALGMFLLIDRGHRLLRAQNEARLVAERQLAVTQERERIAREMHDSLAQVLGVAHLQLRAMSSGTEATPALRAQLDDLAETCHGAYADVREAILGLRQHVDGERSWLDGIEHYLAAWQRTTGLDARLVVAEGFSPDLSPSAEVQLIRVVQEALTNVRKHARAQHVEVVMSPTPEGMRLAITDDGAGFEPATLAGPHAEGGFGLQSMRERTEQVGGHLRVESDPGKGTSVVIEVPRGVLEAVAP